MELYGVEDEDRKLVGRARATSLSPLCPRPRKDASPEKHTLHEPNDDDGTTRNETERETGVRTPCEATHGRGGKMRSERQKERQALQARRRFRHGKNAARSHNCLLASKVGVGGKEYEEQQGTPEFLKKQKKTNRASVSRRPGMNVRVRMYACVC